MGADMSLAAAAGDPDWNAQPPVSSDRVPQLATAGTTLPPAPSLPSTSGTCAQAVEGPYLDQHHAKPTQQVEPVLSSPDTVPAGTTSADTAGLTGQQHPTCSAAPSASPAALGQADAQLADAAERLTPPVATLGYSSCEALVPALEIGAPQPVLAPLMPPQCAAAVHAASSGDMPNAQPRTDGVLQQCIIACTSDSDDAAAGRAASFGGVAALNAAAERGAPGAVINSAAATLAAETESAGLGSGAKQEPSNEEQSTSLPPWPGSQNATVPLLPAAQNACGVPARSTSGMQHAHAGTSSTAQTVEAANRGSSSAPHRSSNDLTSAGDAATKTQPLPAAGEPRDSTGGVISGTALPCDVVVLPAPPAAETTSFPMLTAAPADLLGATAVRSCGNANGSDPQACSQAPVRHGLPPLPSRRGAATSASTASVPPAAAHAPPPRVLWGRVPGSSKPAAEPFTPARSSIGVVRATPAPAVPAAGATSHNHSDSLLSENSSIAAAGALGGKKRKAAKPVRVTRVDGSEAMAEEDCQGDALPYWPKSLCAIVPAGSERPAGGDNESQRPSKRPLLLPSASSAKAGSVKASRMADSWPLRLIMSRIRRRFPKRIGLHHMRVIRADVTRVDVLPDTLPPWLLARGCVLGGRAVDDWRRPAAQPSLQAMEPPVMEGPAAPQAPKAVQVDAAVGGTEGPPVAGAGEGAGVGTAEKATGAEKAKVAARLPFTCTLLTGRQLPPTFRVFHCPKRNGLVYWAECERCRAKCGMMEGPRAVSRWLQRHGACSPGALQGLVGDAFPFAATAVPQAQPLTPPLLRLLNRPNTSLPTHPGQVPAPWQKKEVVPPSIPVIPPRPAPTPTAAAKPRLPLAVSAAKPPAAKSPGPSAGVSTKPAMPPAATAKPSVPPAGAATMAQLPGVLPVVLAAPVPPGTTFQARAAAAKRRLMDAASALGGRVRAPLRKAGPSTKPLRRKEANLVGRPCGRPRKRLAVDGSSLVPGEAALPHAALRRAYNAAGSDTFVLQWGARGLRSSRKPLELSWHANLRPPPPPQPPLHRPPRVWPPPPSQRPQAAQRQVYRNYGAYNMGAASPQPAPHLPLRAAAPPHQRAELHAHQAAAPALEVAPAVRPQYDATQAPLGSLEGRVREGAQRRYPGLLDSGMHSPGRNARSMGIAPDRGTPATRTLNGLAQQILASRSAVRPPPPNLQPSALLQRPAPAPQRTSYPLAPPGLVPSTVALLQHLHSRAAVRPRSPRSAGFAAGGSAAQGPPAAAATVSQPVSRSLPTVRSLPMQASRPAHVNSRAPRIQPVLSELRSLPAHPSQAVLAELRSLPAHPSQPGARLPRSPPAPSDPLNGRLHAALALLAGACRTAVVEQAAEPAAAPSEARGAAAGSSPLPPASCDKVPAATTDAAVQPASAQPLASEPATALVSAADLPVPREDGRLMQLQLLMQRPQARVSPEPVRAAGTHAAADVGRGSPGPLPRAAASAAPQVPVPLPAVPLPGGAAAIGSSAAAGLPAQRLATGGAAAAPQAQPPQAAAPRENRGGVAAGADGSSQADCEAQATGAPHAQQQQQALPVAAIVDKLMSAAARELQGLPLEMQQQLNQLNRNAAARVLVQLEQQNSQPPPPPPPPPPQPLQQQHALSAMPLGLQGAIAGDGICGASSGAELQPEPLRAQSMTPAEVHAHQAAAAFVHHIHNRLP